MWTDYLSVGNQRVGMRVLQTATNTLTTRYFHTDNLGSISVITDENGVVQERLSYDAWGKRRYPDGTDDPTDSITSQTTRGFTGQEELSVSGLVHLNGRVYDPLLARFTSADPTVTDPTNMQSWNRYSYVGNDPLAFTDPNGFSWLSSFFDSVGHALGNIANFLTHNPIVRAILQIAATAILTALLPVAGPFAALDASLDAFGGSVIANGLAGGKLGQILKAGAIAAITAFAFYEVGDLTPGAAHPETNPAAYAENVAGHAAVGCVSSIASGAQCGPGALSGAVGSALSPLTNDFPNPNTDLAHLAGATALEATAGGLASVAGGGKFANGTVTGAFGYLFNDLTHLNRTRQGVIGGAAVGLAGAGGCEVVSAGVCTLVAPEAVVGSAIIGAVGGFIWDTAESIHDWLSGVLYNESAPTNAPPGTRPIDKWGIPRGDIHDIKGPKGLQAGPTDWVGVTPEGNVITTGPNGEAVNNGHVDDYTNRPLKQFPRPDD
ncbi:MAG: RHS repeat-associated core domain-containing protein [Bradyrhizobium sp.]